MTAETAEALRAYQRQVGSFHTPPGCDDGAIARSFGCNDDYIYEFALSSADKVVTLTAYRHPKDGEPWHDPSEAIPQVGTRVGEIYRGPLNELPLPGPDLSEG